MMKKSFILLSIILLAVVTAHANPELPKAEAPVFITAFGQSQDANFVNLLGRRVKLNSVYKVLGTPTGDEWDTAKTFITVLGGSGKGLGAAGLDLASEKARCEGLLKSAREAKKYIIGMHIGGEDRRGPTSEAFIPYAGEVDFMIVRSDGNKDEYFTKLCEEKNVPLYIVESTKEIEGLLKYIFGLE